MTPSAVLFDFDGVIVDTEWAIYQAWLRTFSRHEHDLPLSLYCRCIGSDFDTWSPKLHLEELTGRGFDWETMDADRQVEIRAELDGYGAMPGIREALETAEKRGLPLAVVSSSSHAWVDGWLEKLGVTGYFQEIICRGDAPRIKPAPDLYLEAAKKLGLAPAECLVIEDSHNGLISAHAAGMKTWVVPNRVTSGLDFSLAERIFSDFEELNLALFPDQSPAG
ncbi:MAG: HAD family hydrolase [Luteolibacter sp.]